MKKKILIIAAHPDDEILGCGGSIAKHVAKGDDVDILIVAEGITSRGENRELGHDQRQSSALKKAAMEASKALGCNDPIMLNLPDNRMDELPIIDVIKQIERVILETKPVIIYTHHSGDLNIDHRIVHEAVITACRPMPRNHFEAIYTFEVPSSTEWRTASIQPFLPNHYVNISRYLEKKVEALSFYEMEMKPWPYSRSLEAVAALARWRGASIGREAAEAFMLIRSIVD